MSEQAGSASTGRIVVVGASAGGIPALQGLVAALPADLPAPVVIVLHIPRNAPSALAAIMARAGALPARTAVHRAPLRAGWLYTGPADRHVLVEGGHLLLTSENPERGYRPAIDALLRSAAVGYGPRAIGIVLSGTRDDGSAGLAAIAARGGVALVQDPAEARYPEMPRSALRAVRTAVALPVSMLGAEVCRRLAAAEPQTPSPSGIVVD